LPTLEGFADHPHRPMPRSMKHPEPILALGVELHAGRLAGPSWEEQARGRQRIWQRQSVANRCSTRAESAIAEQGSPGCHWCCRGFAPRVMYPEDRRPRCSWEG